MIQEYENQINSLKKTMENYSQASVRELGYVDEAFQSQLDSMSDAEQTVYQELISNIDYRKTNSDGSYQYDLKGNYKMKSDEEINEKITRYSFSSSSSSSSYFRNSKPLPP